MFFDASLYPFLLVSLFFLILWFVKEAYGNVSSDSSDDEDWTENVIPRKRKNLSGNVASLSPNGNTLITENGTNTKDIKHDLEAAGRTPKQRTRQKLNLESTNNSLAESHKGSRSPGFTGEKSRQSSYKILGEAVTEVLFASFSYIASKSSSKCGQYSISSFQLEFEIFCYFSLLCCKSS